MGSITRGLSNNITTGGVILPAGITNASVSAVTSFANASAGTLILLSTQTASASATISFTTGLDSTYDMYEFHCINIHPSSATNARLQFNLSTDGGSNYNVTKTTTSFYTYHDEAGTDTALGYNANADLAQSTSFQNIITAGGMSADNDSAGTAILQLFNPSSTTYVKHFIAVSQYFDLSATPYSTQDYTAGYANTTSAINAIRFQLISGNMDDGVIKMYGLKKS
jgi:hypothetical protein